MKKFLIALLHLDRELNKYLSNRISLKPTIKYIKANRDRNINAEQPYKYLVSTYNNQIVYDLMLEDFPMTIISWCKVWKLDNDYLLVKFKNKYYFIN